MNYSNLKKQLLRAMRGKESQSWFAKKTGFSSDTISKWERDKKKIRWHDFTKICAGLQIDLRLAFKRAGTFKGDIENSKELFQYFLGDKSISDFGKAAGVSRSRINYFLNGRDMRLEDVLNFIYTFYHLSDFINFISVLCSPEDVPILKRQYSKNLNYSEIYFSDPFISLIEAYIQTEKYKKRPEHKKGLIAKNVGISLSEEELGLDLLLKNGIIALENNKYIELDCDSTRKISPPKDLKKRYDFYKYMCKKTQSYVNSLPPHSPDGLVSFQIFSLNKETRKAIKTKVHQFIGEINKLLDHNTDPKEVTNILNINFFDPHHNNPKENE